MHDSDDIDYDGSAYIHSNNPILFTYVVNIKKSAKETSLQYKTSFRTSFSTYICNLHGGGGGGGGGGDDDDDDNGDDDDSNNNKKIYSVKTVYMFLGTTNRLSE
jgi:hypothetical protein